MATLLRRLAGILFRCIKTTAPSENAAMMKIIVAVVSNLAASPLRTTYAQPFKDMFDVQDDFSCKTGTIACLQVKQFALRRCGSPP